MPLYPRHHIDIAIDDLGAALVSCARDLRSEAEAERLESFVAPDGEVLAMHSVRSGFDLLLTALALPPGSEVLLSALTIPDMPRIVRAHGLVAVPVDVDAATLSPTEAALEQAWSPQAKVLVVAQLFGGRASLDAARAFALRRGLLFVDDDAQGYTGPSCLAPRDADVVFHSFGTIKTATCLGGALVRVRDATLRADMRAEHARWPVHPTATYAKKLALYTTLLVPREPHAYTLFAACAERFGGGLDSVVMSMTKGFPSADLRGFLQSIRRRPCGPLLALLRRRIASFDPHRLQRRAEAGERLLRALAHDVEVLGGAQRARTHWLFAVLLAKPDAPIAILRRAGFDAARGATSIAAVPAPDERPQLVPAQALAAMERVLFVPVYPEISQADRDRLAASLVAVSRAPR
ncbi:MAG: DegT/DnrJ/EryC1/StrS family aminotransferase [Deltaproteobacteria bacterium]|nr:DegT/DnrJ/EryC1/StrS family aminotransferase [Deltaproteobacteria bacterium]